MANNPAAADASTSLAEIQKLLNMEKLTLSSASRVARSGTERWMKYLGFPLGIIVFGVLYHMPAAAGLSASAQASAACFLMALVWWITEPIPTYVTSFVLMILLVITRAWEIKPVLDVLGMDVIWLNIMSFILASILVKTRLAKRLSLNLILHFGKTAKWALFAFVIIQLALAPFIPSTTARCVLTLPLMVVVAAIYGSTAESPNNFGRNIFLLNLASISILSSTTMTGSPADMMAVGFIQKMADHRVYYNQWLMAAAPITIATILLVWTLGTKFIFPVKKEEQAPHIAGGMEVIKAEKAEMGPLNIQEKKAMAIFFLVIFLWATDSWHQAWFGVDIPAPIAAMLGVVVCLLPRWGVLRWDEAEIPWHLFLFSAGAYAGGLALDNTGAAEWAVRQVFGNMNMKGVPFGVMYAIIMAIMVYSHLLLTSKTVRATIMIPLIITIARQTGWNPVSLALPAAFAIDWVVGLPISGKPNVVLFATGQYSVLDNLKFGLAACTIGYALLLLGGMTWFHWMGITPSFSATL
ncbi:SLC13 family permease [Anaeroselena agilis]|uniref:Sodium-dependent dicarboxylate transporter SdcS n=1 Tax=Anaeroselena agilis TaxID=3063788 RepID=A0ABU3NSQ5_9FIRM|nr:SLC13 family permease [Selenomonadales bacterium 4137-cl]